MLGRALAIALAFCSVGRRPISVVNSEGCAEPRTLTEHLRNLRVGQDQTVLNRVASTIEGALQSFSAVGVTSYLLAPTVGFVHNRSQFLNGQCRLRYEFAVLPNPTSMGHIDLDPVGAVIELFACSLTGLYRAVDNLHALRYFNLGRVTLQWISTGCRDRAGRDKHARTGNISAFNGHLDANVAIASAFGFHVAQGSESLFERTPHRYGCPSRAECERILEQLNVVSTFGGNFALQENVCVSIDQTGKDG